jgi:hypothetical protein
MREQAFLLPPDVRNWLSEEHLAWFVLDAVAEIDLSACSTRRIVVMGGVGRRMTPR